MEAATIHCKGHQKGNTDIIKGNNLADAAAKRAALYQSHSRLAHFRRNLSPQKGHSPQKRKMGSAMRVLAKPQGMVGGSSPIMPPSNLSIEKH